MKSECENRRHVLPTSETRRAYEGMILDGEKVVIPSSHEDEQVAQLWMRAHNLDREFKTKEAHWRSGLYGAAWNEWWERPLLEARIAKVMAAIRAAYR